MKAPKILPWIARKAGISDELALKLWRRAASEAEYLCGNADTAEYYGLATQRFLSLVEDEIGQSPQYLNQPAPRLTWFWAHQHRISRLSFEAAQNTYRYWHKQWHDLNPTKLAA